MTKSYIAVLNEGFTAKDLKDFNVVKTIGKLGIVVLDLTDEEFEQIKKHPSIKNIKEETRYQIAPPDSRIQ